MKRQKLDGETLILNFSMGVSDFEKLKKIAEKLNMNRSEYVRFCISNDYENLFNQNDKTAKKLLNLLEDFNKQANAILSNK